MKAAVIEDFHHPPRYRGFNEPMVGDGEEIVDVLAAGMHQLVRSQAAGQHYAGSRKLPMVAGVDGVGRRSDGTLLYFGGQRPPYGTMAERAAADTHTCIDLPADADPAVVAATVNPGMSGWLALRTRAELQPGQNVLVLGATGASGRAAIQVARLLGAGRLVAVGRSAGALAELESWVDALITLDDERQWQAAQLNLSDVDVVVDYLWGSPAATTLSALTAAREDSTRRLTWLQVGSMAGGEMVFNSSLVRSTNVQVLGSGIGTLSPATSMAEIGRMMEHVASGNLAVSPVPVSLPDVGEAWIQPIPSGHRMVVMP